MEAPAVSRVLQDRGQHLAEVQVFLSCGEVVRVSGPARRTRQEALKDCLELRKVAVKSIHDPSLFELRQLVKALKDQTWTVKDLGGRLLDGAEGPPPGFVIPRGASSVPAETATGAVPRPAAGGAAGRAAAAAARLRAVKAPSQDCIIEVADVWEAAMLGSSGAGGDWEAKAEMLLRKAFSSFGPVLEVRIRASEDEEGGPVAAVRFASTKAAEAVMVKAKRGFASLQGDRSVRVRQPSAVETVWRRFPPRAAGPAEAAPGSGAASRKRMRPNERFASRSADAGEPADESEAFWDAQRGLRGTPAEPPPSAIPPLEEDRLLEAVPPPKPEPSIEAADADEAEREACRGEREVAEAMAALLEAPFSQRRKLLKKLRMQWHPDKNSEERKIIATRVFQFIQAHDEWCAHYEIT